MTESQILLLQAINDRDGELNWYTLARAHGDPRDFDLKPLVEAGLIEKRRVAGKKFERLHITYAGKAELSNADRL